MAYAEKVTFDDEKDAPRFRSATKFILVSTSEEGETRAQLLQNGDEISSVRNFVWNSVYFLLVVFGGVFLGLIGVHIYQGAKVPLVYLNYTPSTDGVNLFVQGVTCVAPVGVADGTPATYYPACLTPTTGPSQYADFYALIMTNTLNFNSGDGTLLSNEHATNNFMSLLLPNWCALLVVTVIGAVLLVALRPFMNGGEMSPYQEYVEMHGTQLLRKLGGLTVYVVFVSSIAPFIGINTAVGIGGMAAWMTIIHLAYLGLDIVLDRHQGVMDANNSNDNDVTGKRSFLFIAGMTYIGIMIIHLFWALYIIAAATNFMFPITAPVLQAIGPFHLGGPTLLKDLAIAFASIHFAGMTISYIISLFSFFRIDYGVMSGKDVPMRNRNADGTAEYNDVTIRYHWWSHAGRFNLDAYQSVLLFALVVLIHSMLYAYTNRPTAVLI
jgi:hypothetical protein